jgi:hypothetical protein
LEGTTNHGDFDKLNTGLHDGIIGISGWDDVNVLQLHVDTIDDDIVLVLHDYVVRTLTRITATLM